MNNNSLYEVMESIGTFADESSFKKKFMSMINDAPDKFKTVLAIENSVEPGMPDLIVIDIKGRSIFIEVKYAKRGVITFKKTQLPWYRRHRNLMIHILAYNDLTENIHLIDASVILMKAQSVCVRLEDEAHFVLKESSHISLKEYV